MPWAAVLGGVVVVGIVVAVVAVVVVHSVSHGSTSSLAAQSSGSGADQSAGSGANGSPAADLSEQQECQKLSVPIEQQFEALNQQLQTNPAEMGSFANLIANAGQQASAAGFPKLAVAYNTIAGDIQKVQSDTVAGNQAGVQSDETKLQADIGAVETLCGL